MKYGKLIKWIGIAILYFFSLAAVVLVTTMSLEFGKNEWITIGLIVVPFFIAICGTATLNVKEVVLVDIGMLEVNEVNV